MKRYIALFSILVVFASLLVGCDINRMGKDQYYVQITADGIEKNEKSHSGEPYKYFEYKLKGFDKDGKEKELEFTAQKTYVKMHSYAYTTQIKKVFRLGKKLRKMSFLRK